MAQLKLIKYINIGNILLMVIALAVPHWSHGSAVNGIPPNVPDETGNIYLGLWTGCANINGRYIFRPISGGDDCRVGHCVEGGTFVATSNQDDMDLCQKSKVAASFALMSLALCLMAFYQTSVRSYFGMKASHGWAMICQFFIFIFSIVSWASWTSWQTQFNDQDVRLPGRTRINELKLGTGPVLMILVMLLAAWNTWLEKNAYNDEQAEDVRRSAARASQMEKRERLVSDDESANDPLASSGSTRFGDSEAASTKGPAPARPQVKPRRQDSASEA